VNILEYIIRAKDASGEAVSSAKSRISGMLGNVGKELLAVGGVALGVAGMVRLLGTAFSEAFEFQTAQARLKTFLGTWEAAAARIRELQAFKNDTAGGLFQLPDVTSAAMALERLSSGALRGADTLKLVGDVAAATGNSMESVAFAVGKAFGQLSEGLSMDRSIMQLQQLGVLTPESIADLKRLEEQGGTLAQKWDVITTALERYRGGMENIKSTTSGAVTQMKNDWREALENIGKWISEWAAKISNVIFDAIKGRGVFGDAGSEELKRQEAATAAFKRQQEEKARIAEELAKRQAQLDADRQKAAANAERKRVFQESQDAANKAIQQHVEDVRAQKSQEKSDARDALRAAAETSKETVQANAATNIGQLNAQLAALGREADNAAAKLQAAKNWLGAFGGGPAGEWGKRGPGQRDWAAGAADARDSNKAQAKQDKRDAAREKNLLAMSANGTHLSKEDQQFLNDRDEWRKREKKAKEDAKNEKDRLDAIEKQKQLLEAKKVQIAEDTRDACKQIVTDLQQNLKAI